MRIFHGILTTMRKAIQVETQSAANQFTTFRGLQNLHEKRWKEPDFAVNYCNTGTDW